MNKSVALAVVSALFITFVPVRVSAEFEEDILAVEFAAEDEKFIASLPAAKGKYKSRQRPLLIQGAMNSEIGLWVRALKNPVVYRHLNYVYIAGTYKNYPVVVSRTEEFIPNAAASTALALTNFNPVAVINQGTAGGYVETLVLGDIVIGARSINMSALRTTYQPKGTGIDVTQSELLGSFAYDKDLGKFRIYEDFSADPTLLRLAEKISGFNALTGTIGTSDGWNSSVDYMGFLNEKYGVVCEEMETASAAQICHGSGVPFIGIRVISNNITNGSAYQPQSAEYAQRFTMILAENYIRNVLKK